MQVVNIRENTALSVIIQMVNKQYERLVEAFNLVSR